MAAATPAAAAGSCKLALKRELKVTMRGLVPGVTAKVNGKDARFELDSGAFFSTLKADAAVRLGVRDESGLPFEINGFNGAVQARGGYAQELELAGRAYSHILFVLSPIGLEPGYDGLLGENVLAYYDTEYDLANGVVRSFDPQGCGEQELAYWDQSGQPFGVIDIDHLNDTETHIYGRVLINGQPLRAMFDTGSSTSMLTLEAARRLGLDLNGQGVQNAGATYGIAKSKALETKSVPIASFQIDQEVIRNTSMNVIRTDFPADVVLGADFFLSHRVFVSKSQHKLYFTYNGGPVFRLDSDPDPKSSGPAGERAALADADALERRALASLTRRDYAGASADFDRAIALEPTQARLYYGRARARLEAKQRSAAEADLDAALKLDPANVDALILRGRLQLEARQLEAAKASFDTALKVASGTDLRRSIAMSYAAAGQFEPALANLDGWIATHPKDVGLGGALNSRCWIRALWDRELDKALGDCNAALAQGFRVADVLDSRGLVHYRRGEYRAAIADYDAALKAQPNLAWSHLGRGLARLKTGDLAGGRADIAAAEAQEAGIRQKADGYGLAVPAEAAATPTS